MSDDDKKERSITSFLGATIIAMLVFFFLNFLGSTLLEGKGGTVAFLDALWKSAIFGLVFHIFHNFIARLLRWY